MTSLDALHKRTEAMRRTLAQQRHEAEELPDNQVQALLQEGLFRKLALLAHGTVPTDLQEQCQHIDQELEASRTPAQQEAIERYHYRYAGQHVGTKEMLVQKLSRM